MANLGIFHDQLHLFYYLSTTTSGMRSTSVSSVNMETPTPTAAKRVLKANFSNVETHILLEEITMERELLMSGFKNDVTNRKKRAAWDRILVRVNSSGVAQ